MTGFDDIERRCYALDDFWLGPCALLGAMVADDHIAQMWEDNAFDQLDMDEADDAMRRTFKRVQRQTVSVAHRLVWDLCIEHLATKGTS